ncbi:MAG: DUF459 domain-containing protein [Candidatus Marinimicrobia bacterium]|nr:DUF459 domain-containing protein [Candidatus Neomarinimicrobiota bacterium]
MTTKISFALLTTALILTHGQVGHSHAAEAPQRILILGDSMMQIPAHSLKLQAERRPGVVTETFTRIGSGITRLDVFDWLSHIATLVETFQPDASIVFLGTNDRQPMKIENDVVQPTDPRWEVEYARRIGQAMDLLMGAAGRPVYWLQLPDMKRDETQQDADLINSIFEAEIASRPNVRFFPTRPILSRSPGRYSPYVIGERGLPLNVRAEDGIHLNRAGADLLAAQLVNALWSSAE